MIGATALEESILVTLWRRRELVGALVKRTTAARYRGAALGYVWTLLSPLLLMAVYTVVFSLYMRVEMESYPAFLFTAFVPWLWFSSSLYDGTQALLSGANLVARSRLEAEVLPAVAVLSGLVHCLLSLPLVIGFALLVGRPLGGSLAALPLLLAIQFLLTLGPAVILATGNVYLRDIQQIIPPATQILFFLSPILYPTTIVPERFRFMLAVNPWTYLARGYQRVLYEGRFPEPFDVLLVTVIAVVVHMSCELAFRGYRRRLAEEL